jgi:hypothetical protein
VELLEDRTVPSNFAAANTSDLIADITAANAAGGSNTITLAAGTTFTLTAVNNSTDGPTGLPVIAANDNLTIVGNGDVIERKTGKSTPAFRLLDVAAGATLTLHNLTLQGGLAPFLNPNLLLSEGGAIYNLGALTLKGVTVQNNTAKGYDAPQGPGALAAGGGIYSDGFLLIENSILRNNQALGGNGGKAYWYTDPRGGGRIHFPAGPGGDGLGGALYVGGGTADLHGTIVTGNKAVGGQGGDGSASPGLGVGGGVFIDPAASVCLDAFTQANVKNNAASTSGNGVFGIFTTC